MKPSFNNDTASSALDDAMTSGAFARLMVDEGFSSAGKPRLAVAVSGGADSLCLTLLAHDWAVEQNAHVVALTVDHGLRPGSADEARQVGLWLGERGIEHHTLNWRPADEKTTAVQERARKARYQLMTDWCTVHQVTTLLVAHHLEDQGETFLMRLVKGSSIMGLAAMAPRRRENGVELLRPLLTVPKARLRATLQAMGQPWVEDPSNTDPVYERVRVRRLMAALEKHEGVSPKHFAAAAGGAGRLRRVMETLGDDFLALHARQQGSGWNGRQQARGWRVNLVAFLALPKAMQHYLLGRLIKSVGGGAYSPRQAKVERLGAWLEGQTPGSGRTLGGAQVRRKMSTLGPELTIEPEAGRRKKAVSLVEKVKLPYILGVDQPQDGGHFSPATPCRPMPTPHL